MSAILDLYDRRIIAFKISDHNDNPLVMITFDEAVRLEPDAHHCFIPIVDFNIQVHNSIQG